MHKRLKIYTKKSKNKKQKLFQPTADTYAQLWEVTGSKSQIMLHFINQPEGGQYVTR